MPTLLERLQGDLNAARKAQDRPTTLVLGTVLSELKNRQLEGQGDLSEGDAADVVRRAIKRRRESIDMFDKAGRQDLAAKERAEVAVLERYPPAQVGEDELRAAVRAAIAGGAATVGAVMGQVMPAFKGRADGARLNAIAREELARKG